jgi:hypothetical protein
MPSRAGHGVGPPPLGEPVLLTPPDGAEESVADVEADPGAEPVGGVPVGLGASDEDGGGAGVGDGVGVGLVGLGAGLGDGLDGLDGREVVGVGPGELGDGRGFVGAAVVGVGPGLSTPAGPGLSPPSGGGPSVGPYTRVAWKRRVHRTGVSRTVRPVRGDSTIMPSPAYMATWWMPIQLLVVLKKSRSPGSSE